MKISTEEITELAEKRYGTNPHSFGGQRDGFKEGFKQAQQLFLCGVSPRLLFDEGIKYYKELAEDSGQELNIDTATMIAKDYVKHVNHFLKLNEG